MRRQLGSSIRRFLCDKPFLRILLPDSRGFFSDLTTFEGVKSVVYMPLSSGWPHRWDARHFAHGMIGMVIFIFK